MKTYYCVATTIFDNGRIACNLINTVEAVKMPEAKFTSNNYADRYIDYFYTEKEAKAFVAQSKNA